jgi:hypothetical protein
VSAFAVFGHPIEVPAEFEEESLYTFFLTGGAPASRRGTGEAGPLRPNVTVTRQKTDQTLEVFVGDQRRILRERATGPRVLNEGPTDVAGLPGHQAEILLQSSGPGPSFMQWQVTVLRDGYAYAFFCTTTPDRWPQDRPHFEKLIAGWS